MGKAFSQIAEKASPAVVGIKAETKVSRDYPSQQRPFDDRFDPFNDDLFDWFFRRRSPSPRRRSPAPEYRQLAQGSGFLVSADGYILTNNHLVGEADEVKVTLTDGREFTAKNIGTDPDSDIALVKIDAEDLPYLELADSDALEVGEWVIAIGNPFGLSHTVTAGIVSAKGRSGIGLTTYEDFIQTDAAINPGNSGGPLLNLDGQVIGINTAIVGSTGNIGIGLAIPVNMAKSIYDQLVESGTVVRGFLGVGIQDLTPELAESFGLEEAKGVLVPDVTPDSAAEKAGIEPGDVIIELDGKGVEKARELQNRIAMIKPGTKVELLILRDGKEKRLLAELSERPAKGQLTGGTSEVVDKLGIKVDNLTDQLARRFGYEDLTGVIITEVRPGSLAAMARIQPGTLIQEVNRKPVENTKQFDEQIKEAAEEGTVLLRIRYENYSRFVVLSLPKD